MTLEPERLMAINKAREFLNNLFSDRKRIKKKELREDISFVLLHFPEEWWVDYIKDYLLVKDEGFRDFLSWCNTIDYQLRSKLTIREAVIKYKKEIVERR